MPDPTLTMTSGPTAGQRFNLSRPLMILGRHPDCDVVLDAGAVSRQHAQIVQENDEFFIEDLNSRNGTFVNNQAIQGRKTLLDGDVVRICDLAFRFRASDGGVTETEMRFGDSKAVVIEDERTPSSSKIMTKLEVSEGSRSRLDVNPLLKLKAVLEITRKISGSLTLKEVLPKVLDSLFSIFIQADRAFVILRNPDGTLIPMAEKFRRPDQHDTVRISRTVVDEVMKSKEAVLSADAASDERFAMSESIADFRIRSVMCAPLMDNDNNVLGVIQVDTNEQRSRFDEEDLEVLVGVAGQAGLAIQNAQMHDNMIQQEALRRDLQMAHRIQQGFLPAAPPRVAGYRFFDFYEPANEVGGDYYDYIELPDQRWAVLVADVSGKGISAALITAKLSAESRFCLASENDPAVAMTRLNHTFCQAGWEDRFVTVILAVLDPSTGKMVVGNAGHLPPLVRYNKNKSRFYDEEVAGLPMGIDPDYEYESFELSLAPGDHVALFTDGLSEAMNANEELYGLERLCERFCDPIAAEVELGRYILDDVTRHTAGHSQSDDMCLVCIGRDA